MLTFRRFRWHCVIWHNNSVAAIVEFARPTTEYVSFPPWRYFGATQRVNRFGSGRLSRMAANRCGRCDDVAIDWIVFVAGRQYEISFRADTAVTGTWRWLGDFVGYLALGQGSLMPFHRRFQRSAGRSDRCRRCHRATAMANRTRVSAAHHHRIVYPAGTDAKCIVGDIGGGHWITEKHVRSFGLWIHLIRQRIHLLQWLMLSLGWLWWRRRRRRLGRRRCIRHFFPQFVRIRHCDASTFRTARCVSNWCARYTIIRWQPRARAHTHTPFRLHSNILPFLSFRCEFVRTRMTCTVSFRFTRIHFLILFTFAQIIIDIGIIAFWLLSPRVLSSFFFPFYYLFMCHVARLVNVWATFSIFPVFAITPHALKIWIILDTFRAWAPSLAVLHSLWVNFYLFNCFTRSCTSFFVLFQRVQKIVHGLNRSANETKEKKAKIQLLIAFDMLFVLKWRTERSANGM